MLTKTYAILTLAVLAIVIPRAADAQVLRLGVAAGPTTPVSGFSDVVDTGLHVRGLASLRFPLVPFGLRGELAYNRMPRVDAGHTDQLAGIAAVTVRLLPTPAVHPYLIGGGGIFRTRLGGEDETSVDPGLTAGLGIRAKVLVAEIFAESRYEHVLGGTVEPRMIPLMIGVTF